jgi:hypothetical protein
MASYWAFVVAAFTTSTSTPTKNRHLVLIWLWLLACVVIAQGGPGFAEGYAFMDL